MYEIKGEVVDENILLRSIGIDEKHKQDTNQSNSAEKIKRAISTNFNLEPPISKVRSNEPNENGIKNITFLGKKIFFILLELKYK